MNGARKEQLALSKKIKNLSNEVEALSKQIDSLSEELMVVTNRRDEEYETLRQLKSQINDEVCLILFPFFLKASSFHFLITARKCQLLMA